MQGKAINIPNTLHTLLILIYPFLLPSCTSTSLLGSWVFYSTPTIVRTLSFLRTSSSLNSDVTINILPPHLKHTHTHTYFTEYHISQKMLDLSLCSFISFIESYSSCCVSQKRPQTSAPNHQRFKFTSNENFTESRQFAISCPNV